MSRTHTAFIGLGSNLGERRLNLERASALFLPQVQAVRFSSVWQTAPWGFEHQPQYLNQTAQVTTGLSPAELLTYLKHIERVLGRKPSFKYGPRLIDLDILFYDDLVHEEPGLSIPHTRLAERAFVLVPLNEIAPDHMHPVLQMRVSELAAQVDAAGVSLYEEKYHA